MRQTDPCLAVAGHELLEEYRRLDGCLVGEAKIIRFPLDRATAIAIATVTSVLGTEMRVEEISNCCFGYDAAD